MNISISIPKKGKCIIKEGQLIDFSTPLFEEKIDIDIQISLSKILGVKEKNIFHFLKKFVGETIKKGEVIAVKKAFLSTQTVISEHEGIIREVSHDKGNVTITTTNQTNQIMNAYFKGTAVEIKNNILILKVKEGKAFPLKYASLNFGGKLQALNDTNKLMTSDVSNKIILASEITSYEIIKGEALGCKGFVLVKYIPDNQSIPVAQLKNEDDYKKIAELHFPYCVINKEENTIYIYK